MARQHAPSVARHRRAQVHPVSGAAGPTSRAATPPPATTSSTTVAAVRISGIGPLALLAGHLRIETPVFVSRVDDDVQTTTAPQAAGVELDELEIPHGPCTAFRAEEPLRRWLRPCRRPRLRRPHRSRQPLPHESGTSLPVGGAQILLQESAEGTVNRSASSRWQSVDTVRLLSLANRDQRTRCAFASIRRFDGDLVAEHEQVSRARRHKRGRQRRWPSPLLRPVRSLSVHPSMLVESTHK
jgi:hypothetical protein